jgi:hypothetical protein
MKDERLVASKVFSAPRVTPPSIASNSSLTSDALYSIEDLLVRAGYGADSGRFGG